MPEAELDELTGLYAARGLSPETARKVAEELTAHDALGAHLSAELNIDREELVSPWRAALAPGLDCTTGRHIPLLTLPLPSYPRLPATFAAVLIPLSRARAPGATTDASHTVPPQHHRGLHAGHPA